MKKRKTLESELREALQVDPHWSRSSLIIYVRELRKLHNKLVELQSILGRIDPNNPNPSFNIVPLNWSDILREPYEVEQKKIKDRRRRNKRTERERRINRQRVRLRKSS